MPLKCIVYPRDNEVHSRTIKWCSTRAVKVKQGHHQRVYPYSNLRHFIITFTYVFVSVLKTASYATYCILVKWVIPLDCLIKIHLCESSWTKSPSLSLPVALCCHVLGSMHKKPSWWQLLIVYYISTITGGFHFILPSAITVFKFFLDAQRLSRITVV